MAYVILRNSPTMAKSFATDPFRVVLCHLPDNNVTPYVTWVQNMRDKSMCWGDYCTTRAAADQAYKEKCRRHLRPGSPIDAEVAA